MAGKDDRRPLKVVIVGGSIAGLVLAHSLHRAGIDYVVLEAGERIDPEVGASIGIFSNGARILDQLGVYDEIEQFIEPPLWNESLTGKGKLIHRIDSLQLIEARMGYAVAFLERQRILKILFDRAPDAKKILTKKRVVSVESLIDGVRVHCDDGSQFVGDTVAGADGVHSIVRREMWRHAECKNALEDLAKDKKAMSAEYRCLFGISSEVPGLEARTHYRAFNKHWSFLVVIGKDARAFWFAFERLDRIYDASNLPRYTAVDKEEFVKPFMKRYVSQSVTFESLWERTICSTLTPLEEAQYRHWTYDRFVCLGDSIHKMTPNFGQGGNWAIESAAALANSLNAINRRLEGKSPSIEQLRFALGEYEQGRRPRTKEACDTAGFVTRLEAFASLKHKLIALYLAPNTGDTLVDVHCRIVVAAPKLDFLPIPEKSLRGEMQFRAPLNSHGLLVRRVLRALPIICLFVAAHLTLSSPVHNISPISTTQTLGDRGTEWIIRNAFLSPPDQMNYTEQRQMIWLMGNLAPLQTIWTIESLRRGNILTAAAFSMLFGIAGQWKGIGYAMPIYYFFHYIQSSLDRYAAPDSCLVPTNYAKTLVVAVGVGYILPTICVFLGLSSNASRTAISLWQLFPILTTILHWAFASFVSNTTNSDRIKHPRVYMPYVRRAYISGAAFSGMVHLYLWATSRWYMCDVLFDSLQWWERATPAMTDFGRIMRYNQLITFCSGFIWLLLHFHDLSVAGRLKADWTKVIAVLIATTVLFGPGTAMAVGWAGREELLTAIKAKRG